MIFTLDMRSSNVGGGVTAGVLSMLGGPTGEAAVAQMRLARRAVLLTHGYNVDRSSGYGALHNLATFLDDGPDLALVAILWPGDSRIPVITYPLEGRTADDTAQWLARFILERGALQPGTSISAITHSLGARVAMETLKRLLGSAYPRGQVCLMAPALVDSTLARTADYRATTEDCERVAVLSSRRDRVLRWSFPVGNLLGVFPLFRNTTVGLALGYHGPRAAGAGGSVPANVLSEPIPEIAAVDHGDYLPRQPSDQAPTTPEQSRRALASQFAAKVIRGVPSPDY